MATPERRDSLRIHVTLPVTEEFNGNLQTCSITNISEHGMNYLRPRDTIKRKGREVFLTFSLLERLHPIHVLGWVVKERETEDQISTHVTFMFLPDHDEDMIRNFVSHHSRKNSKN